MDGLAPGRIVHYVADGDTSDYDAATNHRAAIITQVIDRRITPFLVGLCVFDPSGTHYVEASEYDYSELKPGTWHFPERA